MKIKIILFLGLFLILHNLNIYGQKPVRTVKNNTIISDRLPQIKVAVLGKFEYIGRFEFTIKDVAAGERFLFVDALDKKVKRLFIAQFEGFLPGVENFYRYSFANATDFGGHKFRQNTFAYSNKEARENNPDDEAAKTFDFLSAKGFEVEDELMMSRFLTVPDEEKRNELILFYLENVSSANQTISEFYSGEEETDLWRNISKDLTERALKSFKIK